MLFRSTTWFSDFGIGIQNGTYDGFSIERIDGGLSESTELLLLLGIGVGSFGGGGVGGFGGGGVGGFGGGVGGFGSKKID